MRRLLLAIGIVVVIVGDALLVFAGIEFVNAFKGELAGWEDTVQIAVAPVVIGEKASTQREFRQLVLTHNLRTMVDAYQEVGVRNPAWDEAALRLLRGYAAVFAGVTDQPTNAALLADAKRALAAGCTDPLVLYCSGVALQDNGDPRRAQELISQSLEGLQKSRYPGCHAASAAVRLACLSRPETKSARTRWRDARPLLLSAATDGSYRKGEERVLLADLTEHVEDIPTAVRDGLYQDLQAAKGVDLYALAVFGADVEVEAAWDARTDAYASEVTEEGWRGFREHLGKAREVLTAAWEAHPEYPEAPSKMIRVSAGLDEDELETRVWFDRTLSAQADRDATCDVMLWFMRPRWGGSHDAMYQFGVECLRTKRFDTETPRWFLDALTAITEDLDGDKEYWLRPETRKHLKALFEGYAASDALQEVEKQRFRLLHAGAEWYLGNYEEARSLFEGVTWEGATAEFEDFYGEEPEVARGESLLFSGATADEGAAAQAFLDDERWSEAAKAYGALAAKADLPTAARAIAEERREQAQWELDFEQGKWVSLLPEPSLSGWEVDEGSWSVESDGVLVGVPGETGGWVRCMTELDQRTEVRGAVDLVPGEGGRCTPGAVFFGWPDSPDCEILTFTLDLQNQQARLKSENGKTRYHRVPAVVQKRNEFLVSIWDDKVWTRVNGKPAHQEIRFGTDKGEGPMYAGLGSEAGPEGAAVRFSDLEVRRLTRRP